MMICFSRANEILVLRICIRAGNNRTFNVYNRGTLENYSIETYRFTSCAFTFRPLHESPLHRSQNNRSAFFNSAGFLPSRLAPGISFPVSRSGAVNVFTWGAVILELQSYPHPPRFNVLVPRLTRAVRHYEFGVWTWSFQGCLIVDFFNVWFSL